MLYYNVRMKQKAQEKELEHVLILILPYWLIGPSANLHTTVVGILIT